MQLSTDKIPNKMLVGPEVIEIAVKEFRDMLMRDCMFGRSIAYKKVAMTLTATFQLGYPHTAPHTVKSRVLEQADGVVQGETPLKEVADEDQEVLSLERDVKLDNPNLARVQHDMPIKIQERTMPQPLNVHTPQLPGEPNPEVLNPFPGVVTHELKYDKTQYPQGDAPVDRDMSDKAAASLGVTRKKK